MTTLSTAQLADLKDLQSACQVHGTEVVIIGAIAYRLFIDDIDRETRDIDLAVAVDLENLAGFLRHAYRSGLAAGAPA